MKCTPDLKWKYLRETDKKFFNSSRNTTLEAYLSSIFPNNMFEYQSSLQKSEVPEGVTYKKYVCDAISRELKLVVEFDGLNHYMDSQICINDVIRDNWFSNLEYHTVRIPYWVQLSRDVIHDLFNVNVSEPYCELDYNFYNPEKNVVNLNITPGNMCELGRERFVREFNRFSSSVRKQILNDLITCAESVDPDLVCTILPLYMFNWLDVEDIDSTIDPIRFDRFIQLYRHYVMH